MIATSDHYSPLNSQESSMLRMPFAPTPESAAGLREVIIETARATGLNEFQVATAASYFFEELANAVAAGKTVNIPNLGKFYPWLWQQRFGDKKRFVVPRFSASRSWSRQLYMECSVGWVDNRVAENYRKNNTNCSGITTSARTFMTQLAFRVRIAAQARRLGMTTSIADGSD
jgi:Bacterial DNA-binding protein